ncbi:MAG: diguanylate cyclase [Pontiella sp.]
MHLYFSTIAQLDFFGGVAGVVGAIVLSFAVITLTASYYRFQNIVKMAENTQPEEMGSSPAEILRVQLARYLAGCARRGTSFSISLIKTNKQDLDIRIGSPPMRAINEAARRDDVICVYDEKTAVLIAEFEPEDALSVLNRVTGHMTEAVTGIALEDVRVGIASYPGHGLSGKDLLQVTLEGLEQANEETPIVMPELVRADDEEDLEEEEQQELETDVDDDSEMFDVEDTESTDSKGWKDRRKNAMLDELTGVLKPSAVSAYMLRAMSELRHKKKHAALFCIGVNNMEHILRFHGNDAADAVLVGVSKILQDNLRADDLIGRHEKYAFLVLAECSFDEAEIVGKRINTFVQHGEYRPDNKKLKTTVTIGVSTYPEHGRNLHQLYTAGQKVLDHSRQNDIRAYAVFDPQIHDSVPAKPMKNIKSIQA